MDSLTSNASGDRELAYGSSEDVHGLVREASLHVVCGARRKRAVTAELRLPSTPPPPPPKSQTLISVRDYNLYLPLMFLLLC